MLNKIGTYSLAVLARHHGVRFMVAAPTTTLDLDAHSAEGVEIEQRPASEVTQLAGQPIAPSGIEAWNPVFDRTPYGLIDAIVTEQGVWTPQLQAAEIPPMS